MKYLSYEEVSKALGVSLGYVRIMKSKGQIKGSACQRDGVQVMVAENEVKRILAEREKGASNGKKGRGRPPKTASSQSSKEVAQEPLKISRTSIGALAGASLNKKALSGKSQQDVTDAIVSAFNKIAANMSHGDIADKILSVQDKVTNLEVELDALNSQLSKLSESMAEIRATAKEHKVTPSVIVKRMENRK